MRGATNTFFRLYHEACHLKTDQNGTAAYIRAKDRKEGLFLDFLEKELSENFIGKSYDEIINTNFKI